MGWACGMHGKKNKYRIYVGKPEARRPLERPKIHWKFKCKKVTFSLSTP
jgi:hypothetical protein